VTAVSGAQNVSTTVTITAFPSTSALPPGVSIPFAWIAALLVGLALVGAAMFRSGRRHSRV
jgi:hypothetical protein